MTSNVATPEVPAQYETIVAEFYRELPLYLRCSASTVAKSVRQIARFFRQQSEPWPECFTRENIVKYLTWLMSTPPHDQSPAKGNKERKPASVNDYLKGIRRFAKWAVARDLLDSNKADAILKIKGYKATDAVLYAPEPEDVAKFFKAARQQGRTEEMRARHNAVFLLLADVGLRAHELLAMEVKDVVDSKGEVLDRMQVLGKGGKRRLVPLNLPVRKAIAHYLPLRRPHRGAEDALWIERMGERMTYPALRNVARAICNKAGVKINLHDFRRYALTQLWLQGIDQIDGMALSGHASAEVYLKYIRSAVQIRALDQHRRRSPVAKAFQDDYPEAV